MTSLALLLGVAALVWLVVEMHGEAVQSRRVYYGEDEDFSPWEDWDYPIPDDNASWGDLGEDLNEWKRPFDQERES